MWQCALRRWRAARPVPARGTGTTAVASVALRAHPVLKCLRDREKPQAAGSTQDARPTPRHSRPRPIPRVIVSGTAKRDAHETQPARSAPPAVGESLRSGEKSPAVGSPTQPVQSPTRLPLTPRAAVSYEAKRDGHETSAAANDPAAGNQDPGGFHKRARRRSRAPCVPPLALSSPARYPNTGSPASSGAGSWAGSRAPGPAAPMSSAGADGSAGTSRTRAAAGTPCADCSRRRR